MVDARKAEILQVIDDRKNGITADTDDTAAGRYKPQLTLTAV